MPRPLKAWWDERSSRYYVRLGAVSDKTGKRRSIVLRHENGEPIGKGSAAAVQAAIARRVAELREEERRNLGPTVADLCRDFLAWHATQGSAKKTISTHRDHLRAFCRFSLAGEFYGDRPAVSIGLAELARMKAAMVKAGHQTGYIRIRYASVLALWNWASRPMEDRVPTQLLPTNPFTKLSRPPAGDTTREKFIDPVVAVRLVAFAVARNAKRDYRERRSDRLKAEALRLMVRTGCRPGEAAALRWDMVDPDKRLITIPAREHKTGRKTRKPRRISLPNEIVESLQRIKASGEGHPVWVFGVRSPLRTTPPLAKNFITWFRGLRRDAIEGGIAIPRDCTLYWFRHTWQSIGVTVASAEDVAAAAGNSAQIVLSTYAHYQEQTIHGVADKVAEKWDELTK